ncbi:MAG: AIR synthase related protein [Candidatus Bathyarchaeota archaeon]|nr:AIR synthase related protein [Candidatus Bathyarchaeum sp.]
MTQSCFQPKAIKTARDVSVFEVNSDSVIVVGCDSAGGIGPKPLDTIKVSGYTLGRFTARVALMEVFAVGATPFCLTNTLGVEPDPTGFEIVEGIKHEVKLAGLEASLTLIGSMEKTVAVEQTGIGVTVAGLTSKKGLKMGLSKPDDLLVTIGIPSVKDGVLPAEERGEIADLEDVLKLINCDFVHDVIPVGSQGILHEVNVLAKDCGLCANLQLSNVEAKMSAGPATAVVVSVSKTALTELSGLINKPIRVIGSFCS